MFFCCYAANAFLGYRGIFRDYIYINIDLHKLLPINKLNNLKTVGGGQTTCCSIVGTDGFVELNHPVKEFPECMANSLSKEEHILFWFDLRYNSDFCNCAATLVSRKVNRPKLRSQIMSRAKS